MIDEEYIVKAPVSIDDVQKVLNTDDNDIGRLCTNSTINMWSKHKPVDGGGLFSTNIVGSGIKIPHATTITDFMKLITNGRTLDWSYDKPTGGEYSPYRLADFNGYDHFANCRFYYLDNQNLAFDFDTDSYLQINIETIKDGDAGADTQLTVDDLNISKYYLGVVIEYNSNIITIVTNATTLDDNNVLKIPKIKLASLDTGSNSTYYVDVYPFLYTNGDDGSGQTKYCAIPFKTTAGGEPTFARYPIQLEINTSANSVLNNALIGLRPTSGDLYKYYGKDSFLKSDGSINGYLKINARKRFNDRTFIKATIDNSNNSSALTLRASNLEFEISGSNTKGDSYILSDGAVLLLSNNGDIINGTTSITIPARTTQEVLFSLSNLFNYGNPNEQEQRPSYPNDGLYKCYGIFIKYKNTTNYIAAMPGFCFKQDSSYNGTGEYVVGNS